jgi:hypothetical protein
MVAAGHEKADAPQLIVTLSIYRRPSCPSARLEDGRLSIACPLVTRPGGKPRSLTKNDH